MKTEREKRLEAALQLIVDNPWHATVYDTARKQAREALSDEGSSGGKAPEPRRHWCGNCGREIGRHEKCPYCQPDATSPQRRDALEAFDYLMSGVIRDRAKGRLRTDERIMSEDMEAIVRRALTEPDVPEKQTVVCSSCNCEFTAPAQKAVVVCPHCRLRFPARRRKRGESAVPEAVRRLPEQLRAEALSGCPAEYADRGMARNWAVSEPPDRTRRGERLRIADMLDQAIAQQDAAMRGPENTERRMIDMKGIDERYTKFINRDRPDKHPTLEFGSVALENLIHDMMQEIKRLRALAQHGKRVPEGWKLVPAEPTGDMIEAAADVVNRGKPTLFFTDQYRAMLAAAPEPGPEKNDA